MAKRKPKKKRRGQGGDKRLPGSPPGLVENKTVGNWTPRAKGKKKGRTDAMARRLPGSFETGKHR